MQLSAELYKAVLPKLFQVAGKKTFKFNCRVNCCREDRRTGGGVVIAFFQRPWLTALTHNPHSSSEQTCIFKIRYRSRRFILLACKLLGEHKISSGA